MSRVRSDFSALGNECSKWELAVAAALNLQPRSTAVADLELLLEPTRTRVATVLRKLHGFPLHWGQEVSNQILESEVED